MSRPYLILFLAPYSVLFFFSVLLLAATIYASGARFVVPNGESYASFSVYLLIPVFLLFFLKNREPEYFHSARHDLFHKALLFAATLGSVIIHFFLKILALVFNPERYDATYARIDAEYFAPAISLLKSMTALPFFDDGGYSYHVLYLAFFWIGPMLTYKLSYRVFCLCITMIMFNLTLGSFAYMIAPAYGPFSLEPPFTDRFAEMLARMREFSAKIEASGGKDIDPGFYFGALAAMPSLHVSQSVCILWAALRLPNSLAKTIFCLFFAYGVSYIFVWAVLSGFHYFIDLVFGLLLAVASIGAGELSCRWYLRKLQAVLHER